MTMSRRAKNSGWKKPEGRHAVSFLDQLYDVYREFQTTDRKGRSMPLEKGLVQALTEIVDCSYRKGKLILIGNGGSAAIASHQAVDYWKNGGIPAMTFNDSSLLTCIGNDCGFENLFSEPINRFANKGDVLLAISSSGRSLNILNGVKRAKELGCSIITFSGFTPNNPLRRMGTVNFYVPSSAYGLVEVSHLTLIHAMLREVIYLNPNANKKGY